MFNWRVILKVEIRSKSLIRSKGVPPRWQRSGLVIQSKITRIAWTEDTHSLPDETTSTGHIALRVIHVCCYDFNEADDMRKVRLNEIQS